MAEACFCGAARRLYGSGASPYWLEAAVACLLHLVRRPGEAGLSAAQWAAACAWFGPPDREAFLLRPAWLASQRCVATSVLCMCVYNLVCNYIMSERNETRLGCSPRNTAAKAA